MSGLFLGNLFAYAMQTSILLGSGAIAFKLLRLHHPSRRLWGWQILLAACLALPVLQPRHPVDGGVSVEMSSKVRIAQDPPAAGRFHWPDVSSAVAFVLLAGTVTRLAFFGLGFLRLRRYRRRSQLQPEISRTLEQRLSTRVEVRSSEEVPGPVTFGFFRPVVLVPARWLGSEAVLYHEAIHVRRRDWLSMTAEELVRACLWFQPLVWYAIAQIQLAREEVVDREVVAMLESREQYLETLLAIAAARSGLDLAPAPLFLRKRHLRKRIASLMDEVNMSTRRLNATLAGFAAMTVTAGFLAVRTFPLEAAQESPRQEAQSASKPHVIYKAPIEYPVAMRGTGLEASVDLKIQIDKEGTVAEAAVIRGPVEFRDAALASIRQWRFQADQSVPAQAEITVRFRDNTMAGNGGFSTRALAAKPAPATAGEAPQDGPSRIRVGGNVQSTKILVKVTPIYPRAAKEAHIEGRVRLNVVIAADGRVKEVELESGDPALTDSAIDAVKQWVYETTLLNGEPVEVQTQVDVNYTLLP